MKVTGTIKEGGEDNDATSTSTDLLKTRRTSRILLRRSSVGMRMALLSVCPSERTSLLVTNAHPSTASEKLARFERRRAVTPSPSLPLSEPSFFSTPKKKGLFSWSAEKEDSVSHRRDGPALRPGENPMTRWSVRLLSAATYHTTSKLQAGQQRLNTGVPVKQQPVTPAFASTCRVAVYGHLVVQKPTACADILYCSALLRRDSKTEGRANGAIL